MSHNETPETLEEKLEREKDRHNEQSRLRMKIIVKQSRNRPQK